MKMGKTVPICHRFNKHGPATLNTPATRISRRAQHGQHVIPVNPDGINAIASTSRRYPIAKILF